MRKLLLASVALLFLPTVVAAQPFTPGPVPYVNQIFDTVNQAVNQGISNVNAYLAASGVGAGCATTGCTFTGVVVMPVLAAPGGSSSLIIKNGAAGPVMATIGGTSADIETRTDISLPGGSWGSGNLVNGTAPIFQNQSFSGTTSSNVAALGMFLQQTNGATYTSTGSGAGSGFVENLFETTGASGSAIAGQFNISVINSTGALNVGYLALQSTCNLSVTDGTIGNYATCFGFNSVAHVGAGVSATSAVGAEFNVWTETGSIVVDRIGNQIVDSISGSDGGVQASRDDVALSLNNQYEQSSSKGFKIGLEFGRAGGFFPVSTTGTLIGGQDNVGTAWTVANGIDWHLGTATSNWLQLGSVLAVDGSGDITGTGYLSLGEIVAPTPTGNPLLVKNGPFGSIILRIGGAANDTEIDTNAVVTGEIIGGTSSLSGVALSLQNSAGTCTLTPTASTAVFSCSSDEKLKTDIVDAHSELGYLASLKVHDYTIKSNGERTIGPIAQELRSVHPEMVHDGSDGYLRVDGVNPWVLVKAIQEQQAEIEDLRSRLNR